MNEHPPANAPTTASAAAEAIRTLNHLTAGHLGYQGIRDPHDLYATLGGLTTLVQRLDQTAAQLGQWTGDAARHGRIAAMSAESDPLRALTIAVDDIGDNLREAGSCLRAAAAQLNTAWSVSGQLIAMAGREPGRPNPDRRAGPDIGL
jgi:hypothetical protein